MQKTLFMFLAMVLVLAPQTALAETRYVSDQLIITLRAGKGEGYQVLKTLKTDTPVEVLAEEGAYLKVREPGGETGYVLKQYINRDQPKPMIIDRLRNDLKKLQTELESCQLRSGKNKERLEGARSEYQGKIGDLQKRLEQLQSENQATSQELNTIRTQYEDLKSKAQNVLTLSNENERLSQEHSLLSQQNQKLREQNEKLMMRGIIQWFLAGGGVFFFGWICGKISRRKRGGYLS